MMKLNLMKQFFDTVDADWHSPIADEIASRWFTSTVLVRCIRASANFAFHVQTAARDYVLRFNHASEREPEFIAAELAFIAHLTERGIRAAQPVRSLRGNLIESVSTRLGLFHGVLFEAMPGAPMEFDALCAEQFHLWGRALAELHNASAGLHIGGRPHWQDRIAMARQIIPRDETAAHAELNVVADRLAARPINLNNFGLVHYDFELDNLRWHDGAIGIFDFDDCVYSWFGVDLANALPDELFDDRVERVDLGDERLQMFLTGYRSARQMDDDELAPIPLFLRLDNLINFARIYRALVERPPEDEPAWTTQLCTKLNLELDKYRASFRDHPIRTWLARRLCSRLD